MFNFLGLLDPKSEICHILKFLGVKVAYDLFYGPKTMKIVISPKLTIYSGLSTGPGLTDFQFFGLVGLEIEKSHFPENFSSRRQLWAV